MAYLGGKIGRVGESGSFNTPPLLFPTPTKPVKSATVQYLSFCRHAEFVAGEPNQTFSVLRQMDWGGTENNAPLVSRGTYIQTVGRRGVLFTMYPARCADGGGNAPPTGAGISLE